MALETHEAGNRRRARRKRQKQAQLLMCAVLFAVLLNGAAICLVKGIRKIGSEPSGSSSATVGTTTAAPTTTTTTYATLAAAELDAQMQCRGVLLYDATHDTVLYRLRASSSDIYYPASLTKLLTAAVACRCLPEDAVLTVGSEIALTEWDASMAYLSQGSTLTLPEVLDALLLRSGADAAYCIAVNVARSLSADPLTDTEAVEAFVQLMNDTAKELGATHSYFVTPDGYHDLYHCTTAEDLLKIALYADSFPLIHRCVGQAESDGYTNTNELLLPDSEHYYPYATGLKTGFTDEAGCCLAASAEKDGVRLYAILLGGAESAGRFEDARLLFDRGFALAGVLTEPAAEEGAS